MIEGMDPDDRTKLLEELPTEVAQRLIASLSPEDRKTTQAILGYPPKSVGRLMNPDYIRLRADWTVAHALEHIRKYGRDAETINVVYVVDDKGVMIDDLRLRQVFLADPSQTIESLMNRNYGGAACGRTSPRARRCGSWQQAATTGWRLPVLDSRGVLLGIVTSDDVADVAEEEGHRGDAEDGRHGGSGRAVHERPTLLEAPTTKRDRVASAALPGGDAHGQRHDALQR